jgi:1-acyl-sn-glycerol-3-phosphate acyltransferase
VFWIACAAGHLGHLKVFAKRSISYVPLLGTAMRAMGTVFLSRSWESDKRSIERTFRHLRESRLPYWLLTHPEGTRATPAKLAEATAFARTKNLPLLQHVLLPRVKGLVATLTGLQGSLETVLDVTLCWDKPAGPLPFFFFGQGGSRVVHCYLRTYRAQDIPVHDEELLLQWIYARWREKDELVGTFRATGSFGPAAPVVKAGIPHAEVNRHMLMWQVVVAVLTVALLWRRLF